MFENVYVKTKESGPLGVYAGHAPPPDLPMQEDIVLLCNSHICVVALTQII